MKILSTLLIYILQQGRISLHVFWNNNQASIKHKTEAQMALEDGLD